MTLRELLAVIESATEIPKVDPLDLPVRIRYRPADNDLDDGTITVEIETTVYITQRFSPIIRIGGERDRKQDRQSGRGR